VHTKFDSDLNDAGFALFIVLSFFVVVAIVITPFVIAARTQVLLTRNELEETRTKIFLQGISKIAVHRYLEREKQHDKEPLKSVRCIFGKDTLVLSFQEVSGLIDLNTANAQLLSLGFLALGSDQEIATKLAVSVTAYRSQRRVSNTLKEIDGFSFEMGKKMLPYEAVVEVQEIQFLKKYELSKLEAIFTVYSKKGYLNSLHVRPPLLSTLQTASISQSAFIIKNGESSPTIFVKAKLIKQSSTVTTISFTAGMNFEADIPKVTYFTPLKITKRMVHSNERTGNNPFDCIQFFGQNFNSIVTEFIR